MNLADNIEEMLKKIMVDNQNQANSIHNMERQMRQLASTQNTRPAGTLRSDTEMDPQANDVVILILRNGRELVEVSYKKRKPVTFTEKQVQVKDEIEVSNELEKLEKEPQLFFVAMPPPSFQ